MKYAFGLIGIVFLVCLLTAGSAWAEDQSKKSSPARSQNQQSDSGVLSIDEKKNTSQRPFKTNNHADSDGASSLAEASLEDDSNAASDKAPGIYYQYDKLGRIVRIERIPSP